MAADPALFERRREELIARLEGVVRDDARLLALWLQGSLADGTADPLSDVDAYLAVRNDAFDSVYAERLALVGRVGRVLAFIEDQSLRMVNCLLDGPVKLDLFFVPAASASDSVRPAVRILVDKAGVAGQLRVGWTPEPAEVARTVQRTIRGTLQGAAWPLRMLER